MNSEFSSRWENDAEEYDDRDMMAGKKMKNAMPKDKWMNYDAMMEELPTMEMPGQKGHCDCQPAECTLPEAVCLAHAYVPWQFYNRAFCPEEALAKGTLFPELFGPYKPPV